MEIFFSVCIGILFILSFVSVVLSVESLKSLSKVENSLKKHEHEFTNDTTNVQNVPPSGGATIKYPDFKKQ